MYSLDKHAVIDYCIILGEQSPRMGTRQMSNR